MEDKWISVKERLPEIETNVLVSHIKDKWVCAGELHKNGRWYNQFRNGERGESIIVTHWQPLPNPPKE